MSRTDTAVRVIPPLRPAARITPTEPPNGGSSSGPLSLRAKCESERIGSGPPLTFDRAPRVAGLRGVASPDTYRITGVSLAPRRFVSRTAANQFELGAVLDLPSVGLTDRPLLALGAEPGPERGAASPLLLEGAEVARLLRTRVGARPLVVHPGWRTDLDTAVSVVLAAIRRARTPEPLRRARREARRARAAEEGEVR
jgi:Endonuclease V